MKHFYEKFIAPFSRLLIIILLVFMVFSLVFFKFSKGVTPNVITTVKNIAYMSFTDESGQKIVSSGEVSTTIEGNTDPITPPPPDDSNNNNSSTKKKTPTKKSTTVAQTQDTPSENQSNDNPATDNSISNDQSTNEATDQSTPANEEKTTNEPSSSSSNKKQNKTALKNPTASGDQNISPQILGETKTKNPYTIYIILSGLIVILVAIWIIHRLRRSQNY